MRGSRYIKSKVNPLQYRIMLWKGFNIQMSKNISSKYWKSERLNLFRNKFNIRHKNHDKTRSLEISSESDIFLELEKYLCFKKYDKACLIKCQKLLQKQGKFLFSSKKNGKLNFQGADFVFRKPKINRNRKSPHFLFNYWRNRKQNLLMVW